MSSSFPFSSSLLRELLKQIKAQKWSIGAQKWARETESKHALDLIANPCVDFLPEETGQVNQYLHFIQERLGLNLIESFPRPDVNPFLAAAGEYVATLPGHPAQETRIEGGLKNDEMLWGAFCNSVGYEVSFRDWHAVTYAFRRTSKREQLKPPGIERLSRTCLISVLPDSWLEKLDAVLLKNSAFEVVAN
ncbi:MAG: hypothetical protein ASARMPRED_008120 [Alectoria sarmentosa]|nr:MAG: hypothetical protein ASARMPRED_008120 [Alectoria sarmentosa]